MSSEGISKWEILKKPDLFGRRMTLLYEQQNYFKTYLGSLCTVFLVICLSAMAYHEASKLLKFSIHSLEYYETNKDSSHMVHGFSKTSFSPEYTRLAIMYDNPLIDKSYLNIDFSTSQETTKHLQHMQEISCAELDLSNHLKFGRGHNFQQKRLCFKFPTALLVDQDLSINFNKCTGDYCQPKSVIEKNFRKLRLYIFVEVNNNDVRNKELVTKLKTFDLVLNTRLEKRVELNMIEYQSYSKDGTFFGGGHYFRGLLFKDFNEYVNDINPQTRYLSFNVGVIKDRKIYVQRNIYSFKQFLSSVGGLMKGASVFILIFVYPFREILYYKKLVNEMFVICSRPENLSQVVKINRKALNKAMTEDVDGGLVSKDGKDDLRVKGLVDKIMSLKHGFSANGLFHGILTKPGLTETQRRGSMMMLGLAGPRGGPGFKGIGGVSVKKFSGFVARHEKKYGVGSGKGGRGTPTGSRFVPGGSSRQHHGAKMGGDIEEIKESNIGSEGESGEEIWDTHRNPTSPSHAGGGGVLDLPNKSKKGQKSGKSNNLEIGDKLAGSEELDRSIVLKDDDNGSSCDGKVAGMVKEVKNKPQVKPFIQEINKKCDSIKDQDASQKALNSIRMAQNDLKTPKPSAKGFKSFGRLKTQNMTNMGSNSISVVKIKQVGCAENKKGALNTRNETHTNSDQKSTDFQPKVQIKQKGQKTKPRESIRDKKLADTAVNAKKEGGTQKVQKISKLRSRSFKLFNKVTKKETITSEKGINKSK